jgi:subtilisin family serine protease
VRSARKCIRPYIVILASLFLVLADAAAAGEIAPPLVEQLNAAGPGDYLPIVVLMDAFPEQDVLLAQVHGMNRKDRREHTVKTLKALAESSQASLHATLSSAGSEVRRVRVLWGINGVALEAKPETIEELSGVRGVRRVIYDGAGGGRPADAGDPDDAIFNEAMRRGAWSGDPGVGQPAGSGPTGGDTSGPNPSAVVAPEVIAMGGEQVWDELGYTGAGVIVAVIDSGVDRTHPDLADHIWTNLDEIADNGTDDDGNGFIDDTWGWDWCGPDNDPGPDTNHGTQSAGQVAGDGTDGTVTGMAPDAELMVLGISCGVPDSIAWESSDYAIENGADIITMSYIWPWEDFPDQEAFRRQSDTELAAGVIRVNAAGNDNGTPWRPIPYNVAAPANSPPPWLHPDQHITGGISSTVAAANIDFGTDNIHGTSSRGPAAWEDPTVHTDPDYPYAMPPEYQDYPYENGRRMGLIKPDVSAYGNGTTSTCPGPSYCSYSGTSSATPSVAGTLALMLEAAPDATPARLAETLMVTAEDRGDAGKDNTYGTGLIRAYEAVRRVESKLFYDSHTIDDTAEGNGDSGPDPGERVTMAIRIRSIDTTAPIDDVEAVLSTSTPGVQIHDQIGFFPTVPILGTAESLAPHYTFSIDPGMCSAAITFDLEVRFNGDARLSTFTVGVGEATAVTLLEDDFETDQGWTTDPGTATDGYWVREDPNESRDFQQRQSNPADDSSPDPGTHCYVTGNDGSLFDVNSDDVDGGTVTLTSPAFGSDGLLTLVLRYDRWYYGTTPGPDDNLRTEISNDGGANWTLVEQIDQAFGNGWNPRVVNLLPLIAPTANMRLRFAATDSPPDGPVDAAIDEVAITGVMATCQDHTPVAAQPPNPVGNSMLLSKDAGGHVVLQWDAPPVDAGHDPATLYRVDRAPSATDPFAEIGSATATSWFDVDGLGTASPSYYLVRSENNGGAE